MAVRQAYKKKIEIAFISGDEVVDINSSKIVYLIIEHVYDGRVMPVIYMRITLENDLYARVLAEKDSAKFYLRIQHYDAYSDTSLYKDEINQQFTYILSSTTPEYNENLADANANVDSAYKTITMGLLDMSIMNTLRKSFGGIVKNVDQNSLLYQAVEDTKIVIKTPKYNEYYDSLIIPSIASRKDMIQYLFNKNPFYDTDPLYFIDFNISYLLDKSGEAVSAEDGTLDNIVVDIRSVTEDEAYFEGMEIRDDNYYLYINPANTSVSIDTGTEKVANQLVAGYIGGSNTLDLNINTNQESTTHQTFVRFDNIANAVVYKNVMEAAQVYIEIGKENIDPTILTPNKAITVKNYEGYSDYDGKYALMYKKEIIQGSATGFTSLTTFGIKKLNNIQVIGSANAGASESNSKTTWSTAETDTYSSRVVTTSATRRTTTSSS